MHAQVKEDVAQAGRKWCTCEEDKAKAKASMPPSSSSSSSSTAASATPPDTTSSSSSCAIH